MVKKNIFVCMLVGVLSVCLAASAFAGSVVKLFVNGQELEPDVPPTIVDGRVLGPVRNISEALGATVEWDEETYSVIIDSKDKESEKSRIRLLESILEPKDPFTAVSTWAEGVKARNGAVQYAVMSPEMKDENYSSFVDLNWITGTSSPWIKEYEIIEKCRIDNNIYEFIVVFTFSDSTESTFCSKTYVAVHNFDEKWFVNSIEEDVLHDTVELKYENIELQNLAPAGELSGLSKLEDRQFGTVSGQELNLGLYSGSNNNVSGVFDYGDNRYILTGLGYSHDMASIKIYDLQIKFESLQNKIYLLAAVGSDILGYKYVFFNEAENQWLCYHNWGIPEIADVDNDGTTEILMQFQGLHNNAPDAHILAFDNGQFMVSRINHSIYENTELNKNATIVSSLFKRENGELLVDIDLYGDTKLLKTYSLKADRLVFEQSKSIAYRNTEFGFRFSLPESWVGYTIVTEEWKGLPIEIQTGDSYVETGPVISIRHPLWTSENPRQDIPVIVFTHDQWESLQAKEFHVGAAPIGPSKIDRNSNWVFALPARYNYEFLVGFQEVEMILESNPLEPFEQEIYTQVVQVYFTCSEKEPGGLYPVTRKIPAYKDKMQAAIEEMLEGPSEEEIACGYRSHFSGQTSGMLRSITRDGETVIIDFADFSNVIDKNSIPSPTSFAAGGIMADITWTVFKQFPDVQALRFTFEGDESAFWAWLAGKGYEPETFTRTDWEQI